MKKVKASTENEEMNRAFQQQLVPKKLVPRLAPIKRRDSLICIFIYVRPSIIVYLVFS